MFLGQDLCKRHAKVNLTETSGNVRCTQRLLPPSPARAQKSLTRSRALPEAHGVDPMCIPRWIDDRVGVDARLFPGHRRSSRKGGGEREFVKNYWMKHWRKEREGKVGRWAAVALCHLQACLFLSFGEVGRKLCYWAGGGGMNSRVVEDVCECLCVCGAYERNAFRRGLGVIR